MISTKPVATSPDRRCLVWSAGLPKPPPFRPLCPSGAAAVRCAALVMAVLLAIVMPDLVPPLLPTSTATAAPLQCAGIPDNTIPLVVTAADVDATQGCTVTNTRIVVPLASLPAPAAARRQVVIRGATLVNVSVRLVGFASAALAAPAPPVDLLVTDTAMVEALVNISGALPPASTIIVARNNMTISNFHHSTQVIDPLHPTGKSAVAVFISQVIASQGTAITIADNRFTQTIRFEKVYGKFVSVEGLALSGNGSRLWLDRNDLSATSDQLADQHFIYGKDYPLVLEHGAAYQITRNRFFGVAPYITSCMAHSYNTGATLRFGGRFLFSGNNCTLRGGTTSASVRTSMINFEFLKAAAVVVDSGSRFDVSENDVDIEDSGALLLPVAVVSLYIPLTVTGVRSVFAMENNRARVGAPSASSAGLSALLYLEKALTASARGTVTLRRNTVNFLGGAVGSTFGLIVRKNPSGVNTILDGQGRVQLYENRLSHAAGGGPGGMIVQLVTEAGGFTFGAGGGLYAVCDNTVFGTRLVTAAQHTAALLPSAALVNNYFRCYGSASASFGDSVTPAESASRGTHSRTAMAAATVTVDGTASRGSGSQTVSARKTATAAGPPPTGTDSFSPTPHATATARLTPSHTGGGINGRDGSASHTPTVGPVATSTVAGARTRTHTATPDVPPTTTTPTTTTTATTTTTSTSAATTTTPILSSTTADATTPEPTTSSTVPTTTSSSSAAPPTTTATSPATTNNTSPSGPGCQYKAVASAQAPTEDVAVLSVTFVFPVPALQSAAFGQPLLSPPPTDATSPLRSATCRAVSANTLTCAVEIAAITAAEGRAERIVWPLPPSVLLPTCSATTSAAAAPSAALELLVWPAAAGSAQQAAIVKVLVAVTAASSALRILGDPFAMEVHAVAAALLGPCGATSAVGSLAEIARYVLSPAADLGAAWVVYLHVLAAVAAVGIHALITAAVTARQKAASSDTNSVAALSAFRRAWPRACFPSASAAVVVALYPGAAWGTAAAVREGLHAPTAIGALFVLLVPVTAAWVLRVFDTAATMAAPPATHEGAARRSLLRRALLPPPSVVATSASLTGERGLLNAADAEEMQSPHSGTAATPIEHVFEENEACAVSSLRFVRGLWVRPRAAAAFGALQCCAFIAIAAVMVAPPTAAPSRCRALAATCAAICALAACAVAASRPYTIPFSTAATATSYAVASVFFVLFAVQSSGPALEAAAVAVMVITVLRAVHWTAVAVATK